MATKAEIKLANQNIKVKVKKGDKVKIISGKDKGEVGYIIAVSPKEQKVMVAKEDPAKDGEFLPLNAAIKHKKAKFQNERSAKVAIPAPLHISNVMVIDPKTDEASRLGRKLVDGKLARYSKKSGNVIPDGKDLTGGK